MNWISFNLKGAQNANEVNNTISNFCNNIYNKLKDSVEYRVAIIKADKNYKLFNQEVKKEMFNNMHILELEQLEKHKTF